MKVVIAPDSFKGSLGALQVAQALALGVRRVWPEADIRLFPMADGGEGTLEAVLAATGGKRLDASVTGAHGKPLAADYGVLADGAAVIEVAQVVGLVLPGVREVPVADRTTQGLGELVRHCLDSGVRRFMVGLGGSATNEGGVGMLAALGARFFDAAGKPVAPTLQGLSQLAQADFSRLDERLRQSEITILSDVDNPLCGESGATAVFGPQKGVAPDDVERCDDILRRYAGLCDAWAGVALSRQPGSGAAGGLGYALKLMGGRLQSGAEAVCAMMGIDAALQDADWAITGEGRSDAQTLQGKAPFVVAQHAKRHGVSVTLISGGIEADSLARLAAYFDACYALTSATVSVSQAMRDAAGLLADRAELAARSRIASAQ